MNSPEDLRARRATLCYIVAFCLVWWGIYTFGRDSLDGRDMVENYAWGMQWQWGTDKHPPLSGWITAAWFMVFPFRDGSYYLLNQVNLGLALWLLALAMGRFMTWERVLVAIMLTSLVTIFGPDRGYKFNANTALLPFVAGLVWAQARALQTSRARWFVLAGVFAGGALLTKYFALVMCAAIAIATCLACRPSLRTIIKGTGITAATAMVLIAPHIAWSMRHEWPAMHYMHAVHPATNWSTTGFAYAMALGDIVRFSGIALLVWALGLLRLPSNAAQAPSPTPPRVGLVLFLLAVALTIASALVQGLTPKSPWLIPVFLFVGWVLVDLTPARADLHRLGRRVGLGAVIYLVSSMVIAAFVARNAQSYPARPAYALPQTVAIDATQLYRRAYGQPLQYVAGTFPLPYTLSFYSPDHPHGLNGLDLARSPWIDARALHAGNKLVLCGTLVFQPSDDPDCAPAAQALFGPPDLVRELSYPVYDPPSRQLAVQRYQVLMWRPGSSD